MAHPYSLKEKAIKLRKLGYSLNEIVKLVPVVKSTIGLWVRDVELDESARKHILSQVRHGHLSSRDTKKRKVQTSMNAYYETALENINLEDLTVEFAKILCAMIYWCEGAKSHYNGMRFTNSDPNLVRVFLNLLRKSFLLDESKFRVCIHLHAYHDPATQLDFWSKVTDINERQFIEPYKKANSGKRTREGYQGCISIYYYSNDMARQLLMIAKAFFSVYNKS